MRRMPPLNALRAFEAAARTESFVRAGDELAVTPAAISQQVKQLEAILGVTLFQRGPRGLTLTHDGAAYVPALTAAFDGIVKATEQIRRRGIAGSVRITTLSSLAARWLLPRLPKLRLTNPELDIDVHTSVENVDLRRLDIDMAIRYGAGRWPGLRSDLLMEEEVFPVCAPSLLEGPKPLRTPADLVHHILLHDRSASQADLWLTWPKWLEYFGLADRIGAVRGPGFTDSHMLLQSAENGEGVAIGRTRIVADALRSGKLVRPFPVRLPADRAYHIVCLPERHDAPGIRAVREWLLAEAAADESPLE
jgi:LysR family glycine cleavage system transcriptional activator